jgi:hypothetical protein
MVDGRYVCQGEIARVDLTIIGKPRAELPPGFVIGPTIIGDDGIDHARPTARAERQAAHGRRPDGHGTLGPHLVKRRRFSEWASREAPFTRHCPHCRFLAIVDWPLPS